jgi:pyruvate formate lyase activating enzyme
VNGEWTINVETSLNVPIEKLKTVIDTVDTFIVDIKDWNEEIYYNYTRTSGEKARSNLQYLLQQVPDKVIVRVPEIPDYNTKADIQSTIKSVRELGAKTIDQFTYRRKEAKWD